MEPAKKNYLLFYFVLTVIISFVCCFITAPNGINFGFGRRLFASIASIPTGFIGAMIGDLIRRFAIPDAVFTTGGLFQIIRTKLFWFCGPQLIGMLIGIFLIAGMILK